MSMPLEMSTRPHGSNGVKRQSLSTIESSVTRLLVSTKHLLESLTQWARQEADDKFVSDAYVKLGNDFRAATRSFTNAGVDVSDIGDVPQALRIILEAALSEAPSQENLDRFLPNIRNIIVTLLHNLKSKQLKAKTLSAEKQQKQKNPEEPRSSITSSSLVIPSTTVPTPASSSSSSAKVPAAKELALAFYQPKYDDEEDSAAATTTATTAPAAESKSPVPISTPKANGDKSLTYQHLAPPKENANDALAQLQKGNALQRRASKRFSAYQYAKLTNFTSPTPSNLPRLSSGDYPHASTTVNSSFEARDPPSTPSKLNESIAEDDREESSYIFLQINDKTKKVPVELPFSFAALRLLFVEKFAYSPGSASFPEIYIKDPHTNVSYELEDGMLETEIKSGCLLCLKEEDPYKSSLKSLESQIQKLTTKIDNVDTNLTKEVREAVKSIEFPTIPTPVPVSSETNSKEVSTKKSPSSAQHMRTLNEIQRELLGLKQTQNTNKSNLTASVEEVMEIIKNFKNNGVQTSDSSNRAYMNKSNIKLSEDSDNLLTKVDDLQDVMEALRKDVAQRGVRVGEKLLRNVYKEIEDAKYMLKSLTEYISSGKPVWKKIWEAELDKVCEEQQFFNLQDDLTQDLEEDIKKIEETFDLIEKCSTEQSKQGASKRNKVVAKLYIPEPGESLHDLKDAVLSEVAAITPDHTSRLEAIARAERIREKERETMHVTKFQEELGDFVGDSKLKKSGGIEELEKNRQLKDQENLKSSLGIF